MRSFIHCRITPTSFQSPSNFVSSNQTCYKSKVTYSPSFKISLVRNQNFLLFSNRTFSAVNEKNEASVKRTEKFKSDPSNVNNLLFRRPLASLLQQRRYNDALEFLNSITKEGVYDVVCYNAVIHAFLSQDPPALDSAIQLFGKMDKHLIKPEITTYNILLEFLTKNNHIDKVMLLVTSMLSQEIYPNETSFKHLINMFAAMKDTESVLFYYGSLSRCGIKPSLGTTKQVTQFLIDQKDIHAAYQLFKFTTNIPEDPLIDAQIATMLINFFTDKEDWEKVEEVLEVLSRLSQTKAHSNNSIKFKPDTKLCRAITNYYKERGDAASALNFLRTSNITPDLPTITILISLFTKSNDIASIEYCMEYANKSGLKGDTYFYNSLLAAYAKNKNTDKWENVIKSMQSNNVPFNNITVTLLVELLHDTERFQPLFDIGVGQLENPSIKIDSILCNSLLGALAYSPDPDHLWELYCKIKDKEEQNPEFRVLDAKSYFIVAEGIARSGKTERIPEMAADVANSDNMSVLLNVQVYDQYCWMLVHLKTGNLKQGLLNLTELAKLRQWTYKICEDFMWAIIQHKDMFLFTTQHPQVFKKLSHLKNTLKSVHSKYQPLEPDHKQAFESLYKDLVGTLQ